MFPGRRISCFLSLGTGDPAIISGKGDLAQIAMACRKLIASCERVDITVRRGFSWDLPFSSYFRFSVDQELGNIALDEWNRLGELTAITDVYMWSSSYGEYTTRRCVAALEARAAEVKVRQEAEEQPLTCKPVPFPTGPHLTLIASERPV